MRVVTIFLSNVKIHFHFDDPSMLAMIIGALCHDMDHRGVTNSFEILTKSDIAILYNDKRCVWF